MPDVDPADSADALRALIDRYNDAWNRHDLDAICALHAPGMVFENHTAGERAEGDEVGPHIAGIFATWPDITFASRRLYVREGLIVQEWTATATHSSGKEVSWEGLDVLPFENGLIKAKIVYSNASRRVPEQLGA